MNAHFGQRSYDRQMEMQPAVQQQQATQQRMLQQRGGVDGTKKPKPKPVSVDKVEQIRKELEKKGQVLPDGQKKKPLPGEIAGAARV